MSKVMIIADKEAGCCAVPRGLELAAKLQLDVEVVAFTHTSLRSGQIKPAQQATVKRRLLADRKKTVRERIDKYRKPRQKVTLKVEWQKDIAAWVNKQAASGRYLAIVKTEGDREHRGRSSTDWQLLREGTTPVLLVEKKKWHRTKPVLATLDLSSTLASKKALNSKVLSMARDLAVALGVELKIITAIEIPRLLTDLDLVDPIAYERSAREAMEPQIRKLSAQFGIPEASFQSKRGPAEKVITSRAAKVRAQIVVIGTVARKGVKARLLGNTAEKVLHHLHTDVLAIKP